MVRRAPARPDQGRLFEVETHYVGTDPETADRELRFRMPETEGVAALSPDPSDKTPEPVE